MLARICLLSALLTATLAGPAASEGTETVKWGEAGGWHIRVDRTLDDGCFAQQSYQDGTSLLIGLDVKNQAIYLVIGNDAWRSLEAGKAYPVQFVFDGHKKLDGQLAAFSWGDRVVLGHSNVGADFTTDFMESTDLRLYYRGLLKVHLSLRDSQTALKQVVDCQAQTLAAKGLSNAGARSATRTFSF
jgi:hypothetical protein